MREIDKLGSFYLGKVYDEQAKALTDEYLLYDTKDLTTHAIAVGMTGSGKTGLGIGLLEEAALDNIPSLIIDPKGDMANLMLRFPELRGEDFLPWLSEEEAQKKDMNLTDFAEHTAENWKKGLASWEQDSSRIEELNAKSRVRVYTPGSTAGIPVSLLQSLDVPSQAIIENREMLNDYSSSTVSGLLTLLGINADPVNSKEHILLNTILIDQWSKGIPLDLASFIQAIMNPPVQQFGVMQLDQFYPAKERQDLAMKLNNLLASPQFAVWSEGVYLDIDKFLFDSDGKPCMSVFSIQHLSEAERMFFVSTFLNKLLSWVRSQTGTGSLRALLYMDEIFGYFPPVANPPSKQPLLTLLKQARAYGLGLVLSTQNPVDLDYKGLSNIGTWFIGRLQTEQDKDRLLSGLESASSEGNMRFDRRQLDSLISGLPGRTFLMNNVHENEPVLFQTRWAMSYLAGPMSRQQISKFEQEMPSLPRQKAAAEPAGVMPETQMSEDISEPIEDETTESVIALKPTLAEGVRQFFLPVDRAGADMVYIPSLFGIVDTNYYDKKHNVDGAERTVWNTHISGGLIDVDWAKATGADFSENDLEHDGEAGIAFAGIPSALSKKTSYSKWEKALVDYLYREQGLNLFWSPVGEIVSHIGEEKGAFIQRVQLQAREVRDRTIEDLRSKYEKEVIKLNDKLLKAEQRLEREKGQAKQANLSTAINVGSTILDTLFGRKGIGKGTIGKAATSAKSAGRAKQQSTDVQIAAENVEKIQAELEEMEARLEAEMEALQERYDEQVQVVENFVIKPKKADIKVLNLSVLWLPYDKNGGNYTPCYRVKREE